MLFSSRLLAQFTLFIFQAVYPEMEASSRCASDVTVKIHPSMYAIPASVAAAEAAARRPGKIWYRVTADFFQK